MRCPFCGHEDSQVKDSRPTEDGAAIRRRRQCEACAARFTTFERVQLRVNPLVLELTGKKTPQTGLEGKFSVYHAVAVALVEGAAGEKQLGERRIELKGLVHRGTCLI